MNHKRDSIVVAVVALAIWYAGEGRAQTEQPNRLVPSERSRSVSEPQIDCARVQRTEAAALKVLLMSVQRQITGTVTAMPADKYSFRPTEGEFSEVRTFGQQVKHLAAANQILAAAALGEAAPGDAGDEAGPKNVRTKAEILNYLNDSFAHLSKAIDAIGRGETRTKPSPISPLKKGAVTGESLVVEAMVHSFDHYGQMVEYLRMNGIVPPASLP